MIILGTNSIKDTGFNVANSCRFNDGSTSYMHKTPSSAGNRQKWTFSAWLKLTADINHYLFSSGTGATDRTYINFNDGALAVQNRIDSSNVLNLITNAVHRDVAAWYHFVVAIDTTQGTAANRAKCYVNGTQITSFETETYPDQNVNTFVNNTQLHTVGKPSWTDSAYYDGYMAEVVHIDGQQLAPDQFGEFDSDSNIWKPINVSGLTFGTNGFYLDFEDSANLGNDANGGTDLTEVNLAATNQSTDTCTNNFATLNPLSTGNKQAQRHVALSEGNLFAVGNSSSNNGNAYTTMAVNTGKWYCEIKATDVRGTGYPYIGVCNETCHNQGGQAGLDSSSGVDGVAYSPDGRKNINGTSSSYGDSFTDNDIIGIALDLDNGAVYFSKNGTFQASGDPTSGASKTNAVHTFTVGDYYFFALSVYEAASDVSCNFGSPAYAISSSNADGNGYGNFEYAVPSGFFSLCTKNLAEYG